MELGVPRLAHHASNKSSHLYYMLAMASWLLVYFDACREKTKTLYSSNVLYWSTMTSSACGAGCKNCDSTGACIECMEDYRLDSGSCVGKYVFTVIPQWLSLELRGKTLLTITSICLQLAHLSARPAQLMPPLVPMCALCVITPMDLSSQPAPPVTVSCQSAHCDANEHILLCYGALSDKYCIQFQLAASPTVPLAPDPAALELWPAPPAKLATTLARLLDSVLVGVVLTIVLAQTHNVSKAFKSKPLYFP